MREFAVLTGMDLDNYCGDGSRIRDTPAAVLVPAAAAGVPAALDWARTRGYTVTVRGSGTGMAGGAVVGSNGAVLSLERLQDCSIDRQNLRANVGAGVCTEEVDNQARAVGLWYPVDPSSKATCSIGGNVATNAGGPRAFRFGVTQRWVTRLRGYWADGSTFEAGSGTSKDVAGYDMVSLLCGSEGTLGVVTEIQLRLLPGTPDYFGAVLWFAEEDMPQAIQAAMQYWPQPAALEYFDVRCGTLLGQACGVGTVQQPALLIEWVDDTGGMVPTAEQAVHHLEALLRRGPSPQHSVMGLQPAQQRAIWQSRRGMSQAMFGFGSLKFNEDVGVPAAALPTFLQACRDLENSFDIPILVFGHVGDGNLHVNIMHEPESLSRAVQVKEAMFAAVAELHGTVTGEHGVGVTKKEWLARQIDPEWVRAWRGIKAVLDPDGLLNPGKIFDKE